MCVCVFVFFLGGGGLKYTVSGVEMAGHVTSNYLYSEPSLFHHLSWELKVGNVCDTQFQGIGFLVTSPYRIPARSTTTCVNCGTFKQQQII